MTVEDGNEDDGFGVESGEWREGRRYRVVVVVVVVGEGRCVECGMRVGACFSGGGMLGVGE